jgi:arylsulfatase A-like enzyme
MIRFAPRSPLRELFVLATLVPLGTWTSAQGRVRPPPRTQPNVLLIVLDDVGIENLGFYGYNTEGIFCGPGTPPSFSVTPNLDVLAMDSVIFRRAYSYPVCSAARAALLTGRHAFRTGMGGLASGPSFGPYTLPASERTIPEMLKEGFPGALIRYRCGAFGKWHLTGTLNEPMHPIEQGFDRFVGVMGNDLDHFEWDLIEASPSGALPPQPQTRYSATVVRERAVEWIQSVSEPFFAYVAFNPAHAPQQVPPLETLSASSANAVLASGYQPGQIPPEPDDRLAYDWMIESVDHEIAELIGGLGNRAPRTTILIVSDNGTPGELLNSPYDPAHGKGTVYEQGVRVPFLATGYKVPGRGFHEGVVSVLDLWSTIAELTGAVSGPGGDDSVSLAGLLQDPQASLSRTAVLVQYYSPNGLYTQSQPDLPNNTRAMVSTHLKYIRFSNESTFSEGAYQLAQGTGLAPLDPTECVTLLPPWPSEIQALSDAMTALSGLN